MKIKIIALLGAAGLVAFTCWWWRGAGLREADHVNAEPATVAPAAVPDVVQAPRRTPSRVSPPLDLAQVPARVRPVVDVRQEFWSRLTTVHALGKNLNPQELATLYDFLRTPEAGDEKVRGGEQVLKNDLLNVLRQQANPPAGLARLLIELSQDTTQDAVMRAYAVQHLQAWYSQSADKDSTVTVTEQERTEMQQAFWNALNDTDPTVAGTALLSLHRLSEGHAEFDPDQVAATALRFSQDDSCGPLARSTALQICAERKLEQALPVVLELARGADSIPLQISAIAALGNLGGPDQVPFLEQLATGENERLQGPARTALKQIQQRRVN
ncbi:MAG: HEAT repeat domain-containing protein [Verrucomicrobiota bacterium]